MRSSDLYLGCLGFLASAYLTGFAVGAVSDKYLEGIFLDESSQSITSSGLLEKIVQFGPEIALATALISTAAFGSYTLAASLTNHRSD